MGSNYDVFLSHNSKDKPDVRALAGWLEDNDVTVWLDEAELKPGDRLTKKLGVSLEASRSAIICIGPDGEGPWQSEEIDTLLNKSIKLSRQRDEFRIIPVLLPGADTSKLQWFLETRLWIDLKNGITDNEADLLRLKCAILGERGQAIDLDPGFNPYRGLEAFQYDDAKFFFGRVKESVDLAEKLRDWRFACVVGPSGNGKSSLARAGLATNAARRILPDIDKWKRLFVRPGANLLRSVLIQLYSGLADEERGAAVAAAMGRIVPDAKTATPQSWAEGLDGELQNFYAGENERVLILIDQFEEIFTHRGLNMMTEPARQEQIKFVLDGIAHLRKSGDERWRIVLTLRSDFFQRCQISPPFWYSMEADHLKLELDELNDEGWREAIKGPAARAGAYLEAGLVETMLNDVYRQRGSMPLLQLALQELWRLRDGACLTHTAYTTLGGVGNALQKRAETCLDHLKTESSDYFEIARNLFIRLTSPGEGVSDTRRRVDRNELDLEETETARLEHVLEKLSAGENRLIVTDGEAVEVTHEILIRNCSTIRGWIEAVRGDIPMLRRLSHSTQRWEENGRDAAFLNPADSPLELKRLITGTTLRLTGPERAFWKASRTERARTLQEKRNQRQRLREAQENRIKEAEVAAARIKFRSRIALGFAVAMAIFAVVAFNTSKEAKRQEAEALREKDNADDALKQLETEAIESKAAALMARLSDSGTIPTQGEYETLRNLANSDETIQIAFLRQLLTSQEKAQRLRPRYVYLTHALVGLDTQKRELIINLLAEYGRNLSPSQAINIAVAELGMPLVGDDAEFGIIVAKNLVAAMEKTSDAEVLSRLSRTLGSLGEGLPAEQAFAGAGLLVTAMEMTPDAEVLSRLGRALGSLGENLPAEQAFAGAGLLVIAMEKTSDAEVLSSLGIALGSLGENLPAEQAFAGGVRIVTVMEKTGHPYTLSSLAIALGSLGENLPAEQAFAGAGLLVTGMDKYSGEMFRLNCDNAFRSFGENLPAEQALALAKHLVTTIEKTSDSEVMSSLGRALGSLGENLPAEQALAGAGHLVTAIEKSADEKVLLILCIALGSLGENLPAEQASALAGQIVTAMEKSSHGFVLSSLGCALGSLNENLPAEQALAGAGFLVTAMEKTSDAGVLFGLGSALGCLGENPPPEQVLAGVGYLLTAMEKTSDAEVLSNLGETLGSFGENLPEQALVAGAGHLVTTMEKTSNAEVLSSLGRALGSFGENLPAEQASVGAGHIVDAMAKTSAPDALSHLGVALGSLVGNLPAEQATAVLKSLVCVGEVREKVLARLEKKAGLKFNGDLWKAVEWLEGEGVDVKNTPPMESSAAGE
jgi:hypothetical protein